MPKNERMSLIEAIEARHAVRSFTDEALDPDSVAELQALIDELNEESWLSMQLILDEPLAFSGFLAKGAGFSNASDYLAIVGLEGKDLDETAGYFGEQVVLRAQQLGINSCWVGKTYKLIDRTIAIDFGQKLDMVIALGYGTTQGSAHTSKAPTEVAKDYDSAPEWFKRGVDMALLAPTALNRQKFSFSLGHMSDDGIHDVVAKTKFGPYSKVDLGIVKYHFLVGAGADAPFTWA